MSPYVPTGRPRGRPKGTKNKTKEERSAIRAAARAARAAPKARPGPKSIWTKAMQITGERMLRNPDANHQMADVAKALGVGAHIVRYNLGSKASQLKLAAEALLKKIRQNSTTPTKRPKASMVA